MQQNQICLNAVNPKIHDSLSEDRLIFSSAGAYRWHESTVAYILEYMEYTGCTVNFKTYTNSIWDKKQRENPMENRKIFYNTHPAIISLEVFDKVQEIRQQRHRRTATGKSSLFSR